MITTIVREKHSPRQNHLLAALDTPDYERLLPDLELVPLPQGKTIYETGAKRSHVYFPTTGIISKHYVMEDGASTVFAVVGNEGLLGVALFMGGETAPCRSVVQSAGYAYRVESLALKEEFKQGGGLQQMALLYTQSLITQMAQTAVCNRHHSLLAQVSRWLLQSLDRLPTNQLAMTQELIANNLGVRRESVTEAAGQLQQTGLIEYCRGKITVLDRGALEKQACECYAVVKNEFDRLLLPESRLIAQH
jgi:CRP-like cAMP-binding protein